LYSNLTIFNKIYSESERTELNEMLLY